MPLVEHDAVDHIAYIGKSTFLFNTIQQDSFDRTSFSLVFYFIFYELRAGELRAMRDLKELHEKPARNHHHKSNELPAKNPPKRVQ